MYILVFFQTNPALKPRQTAYPIIQSQKKEKPN